MLFIANTERASAADRCAIQEADEKAWTAQEKWAWRCICAGKIADFDHREGRKIDPEIYSAGEGDRNLCQPDIDPVAGGERRLSATSQADAFAEQRALTPTFVETVLFREPYRGALPHLGVRIRGALFKAPLHLANGQFVGTLSIENSRFEQSVDLTAARSSGAISFNDSDMRGEFEAELLSAGRFEMMSAVLWKKTNIVGARIAGSLVMHGIHAKCDFWADSIVVDGHVYLRAGSKFERITRIRNARVGYNLYLDRSQFFRLDLSGSKIQGEINAGYERDQNRVIWRDRSSSEPAILVLRNASAGALLGLPKGWPVLSLEGFSYGYIKIDDLGPDTMGSWGKRWLQKGHPVSAGQASPDTCEAAPYDWRQPAHSVSFQPYRHYAETIAKAGMTDEANSVLFAGREAEREHSTGWKYWTMTLSAYVVGYGYGWRYFFALGWAAVLVGIAYALIMLTGENEKQARAFERSRPAGGGTTPPNTGAAGTQVVAVKPEAANARPLHLGLLFCVDMLVPLIQFNRKHYEVTLQSALVRRYFIVHRLLGFLLGSFILAGVAGLTK